MAKSFAERMKDKKQAEPPAMMFISAPAVAEEAEEKETSTPPQSNQRPGAGAVIPPLQAEAPLRAPQGGEAKSRRLQLLIQPSLYEGIRARAAAEGLSVNEMITRLLRRALED